MPTLKSPVRKIMAPTNENRITPPITGPLTVPAATCSEPGVLNGGARTAIAPHVLTNQRGSRIAVAASTLALLVGVLLCAFALPARAATLGGPTGDTNTTSTGSGVGTPQTRPVASRPNGSSGDLVFAGLCVAGILATAGGVLAYTVRTRRNLD